MSHLLFDFQCANGHIQEALVPSTFRFMPCNQCDLSAKRIISPVRAQLEGITGSFPGAAAKWEKRRESHMAVERKNMARHGTYK